MSSSKCSFTCICGIFLPLNPSTTTVYARSAFYPSLRFTLSLQSAFYTQSAFYPWSAVRSLRFTLIVLKVRVFVTVGKDNKVGQQRKATDGSKVQARGYKSRPQGPVVFQYGCHIVKRENPGGDDANMYHGGRGSTNIEGGICYFCIWFATIL